MGPQRSDGANKPCRKFSEVEASSPSPAFQVASPHVQILVANRRPWPLPGSFERSSTVPRRASREVHPSGRVNRHSARTRDTRTGDPFTGVPYTDHPRPGLLPRPRPATARPATAAASPAAGPTASAASASPGNSAAVDPRRWHPRRSSKFLDQAVDWYRTLGIQQQAANEPSDLLFLYDNRQTAAKVMGLAFDIARADADMLAKAPVATPDAGTDTVVSPQSLAQLRSKFDGQQASIQAELDAEHQLLAKASAKTRVNVQAKINELQGELDLVNTKKGTSHDHERPILGRFLEFR